MKPFATIRITVSSDTTTASSAPAAHISTFSLKVVPLVPFRLALHRRFPSPLPKPVYVSYHLYTGHPRCLCFQAEHPRSSPELKKLPVFWMSSISHFDASSMVLFQLAYVYTPDTFISTLPFCTSVQHRPRWGTAPMHGLTSAPDSSLPMGQFLLVFHTGFLMPARLHEQVHHLW